MRANRDRILSGMLDIQKHIHNKKVQSNSLMNGHILERAREHITAMGEALGWFLPDPKWQIIDKWMNEQEDRHWEDTVTSDPVVMLIHQLFSRLCRIERLGKNIDKSNVLMKYGLDTYYQKGCINNICAANLHTALSVYARESSLGYPISSPQSLAKRISTSMNLFSQLGIDITAKYGHKKLKYYTITDHFNYDVKGNCIVR